ncbi:hypothetical protein [Cellulomonas fengjieae]|uniref:Uncharacterized protein n=1 Tax=Cellulomonas fengjieae TaxID=2819978 RepID=A0ABS3SE56_9CELL|nr:hypothetical protein [Cellulomonas fengjieae]MBO3083942.1 hypothetical protein [Cellulomonas fengjieae]QVI64784.1 hypothetical protein KG102_11470 [Cellulomonas fengjieae]
MGAHAAGAAGSAAGVGAAVQLRWAGASGRLVTGPAEVRAGVGCHDGAAVADAGAGCCGAAGGRGEPGWAVRAGPAAAAAAQLGPSRRTVGGVAPGCEASVDRSGDAARVAGVGAQPPPVAEPVWSVPR